MGSKSSDEELGHKVKKTEDSSPIGNDTSNGHTKRAGVVGSVHVDVIQALIQDLLKNEYLSREHSKLRAAEKRLSDLFDFAPVGYVTIDVAGTVEEINLTGAKMLGMDKSRLEGKPFSDFITPDTAHTYALHLKQLSANKEQLSCELKLEREDGTSFHIRMDSTGIHDDGDLIQHRSTLTDITERKQAEEALRASEEKYRILFEKANITIFVAQDGRIKSPNPKALDLFAYSEEEFTSRPFGDFIHPDDRKMVQDRHERRLKGEELPTTYSYRIVDGTGTTKWVELNVVPILWEDRPATLCFMTDITNQKQAEDEKKKLEAQLRQSLKMEAIGTLSGGIAHDFNNILGIIAGNTELALTDIPEWNPVYENLSEIRDAGMRARDMVKQILMFSRQTEQALVPVEIGPIIEESLRLIRSVVPTTIDIQQNLAGDTGVISGDPSQINQILLNLCTNASHAMKEEGGVLDISLENIILNEKNLVIFPDLIPGHYVKMTVSDNGHGIAPEEIDRIFDPYFTTKAVGEGTGMGLAVVHGIIANHGGAITVSSKVGKGTTFDVLFPIVAKEAGSKIVSEEAIPRGEERILFVDDEPAMVKIYQSLLERLGYTVAVRTSSIEALEAFKAQPDKYDLIITDQTMPHLTGQMMARQMMAIRPDIPIILCTGHSDLINEDTAKEMGIQAFVMKPIAMAEIANNIRKVLDTEEADS